MKIPVIQANQIFDILVKECGASEYWRNNFVHIHSEPHGRCQEYRFQGSLGFGGKFRNRENRWFVDCYKEDETPERLETIKRTNDLLKQLKGQ